MNNVVSMKPDEVKAILNNPHGLQLLMDWEDFQYCYAESMLEPDQIEPWPTKHYLNLKEQGKRIIEEDTDIWDDDIKRAFGVNQ